MYVYIQSETGQYALWTVGFYSPDGKWEPESDHATPDAAAERVHYLNGGQAKEPEAEYDFTNPAQNPYLIK